MNKKATTSLNIKPEILNDLKQLTSARIKAMSKNVKISIGNKDYTQEEIINHVENADEIGTQIMEMQLEFLQDLANGSLYSYE
ncbi:MAG: hypothetical protein ABIJ03_02820 [Patescibacteria group bacterium]|nr:hypothetical protein [Patescibacteria group bacterium]